MDPPAGFPRGFDRTTQHDRSQREARRRSGPVPTPLGAGRGRRRTASPPGQRPVGCMRCLAPGGRRPRAGDRMGPLLFDNPVVGHASKSTKQDVVVAHQFSTNVDPYGSRATRREARGRGVIVTRTGRRRVARRLRPPANRGRTPAASGRHGSGPRASGRGRRPDRRGQAPKGTGGMPRRHQDSGVEGCEKSGGAAQRASIPECPSETRGTETSQYPEEKKATATPSVAASERGPA